MLDDLCSRSWQLLLQGVVPRMAKGTLKHDTNRACGRSWRTCVAMLHWALRRRITLKTLRGCEGHAPACALGSSAAERSAANAQALTLLNGLRPVQNIACLHMQAQPARLLRGRQLCTLCRRRHPRQRRHRV